MTIYWVYNQQWDKVWDKPYKYYKCAVKRMEYLQNTYPNGKFGIQEYRF